MNYCDVSAHCFSPLGSDGSNKISAEWNAPMHSTEMIPTAKWTSSGGKHCVGVVGMLCGCILKASQQRRLRGHQMTP